MLRKESATTRIRQLLKENTLYRFEGTTPSFLYVIIKINEQHVVVKALYEDSLEVHGNIITGEIFEGMWVPCTRKVEDAKSKTIAALRGLI